MLYIGDVGLLRDAKGVHVPEAEPGVAKRHSRGFDCGLGAQATLGDDWQA